MVIGIDASRANQREKTGTEWYSWHVIRRLPAVLPEHTFRLYVREPLEKGLQHLGPNVEEVVLKWPPAVMWSHIRLSYELLLRPPDALFVPADTVPLVHPRLTMTTIHDVAFERFPELYRGASVQRRMGWLRPFVHFGVRVATLGRYSANERDYHRWSVRHALRTCRRIVTVSEFSKKEIVELLQADPDQIGVTPLGVAQAPDYDQLPVEQIDRVKQELRLHKPFILFLGRLESKKNILNIVRGYAAYAQRATSPAELVLAGSPGMGWDDALRFLNAQAHPLPVRVLGWQPSETIHVLQREAAACIFISLYEGFGLPGLESMSAGVPVVASRTGSIPEVLGDAARYVDAHDPDDIALGLAAVIEHDDVRQRCIQLGRERVRSYTWDKTAQRTAEELKQLLARDG